jgi:hypothetical protein
MYVQQPTIQATFMWVVAHSLCNHHISRLGACSSRLAFALTYAPILRGFGPSNGLICLTHATTAVISDNVKKRRCKNFKPAFQACLKGKSRRRRRPSQAAPVDRPTRKPLLQLPVKNLSLPPLLWTLQWLIYAPRQSS